MTDAGFALNTALNSRDGRFPHLRSPVLREARRTARASLLVCAAMLAAPIAHAGTIMEAISRDLIAAGEPVTITTAAQDGRMRVEAKPGDGVMVFRDDAIYNINHKDKSYIVMDRASMQRMAEQLNPMLQQLQAQLANMPPEQRAQVEKMMGGALPGAAPEPQEFRKTARSGSVSGLSCKYVEIYESGARVAEACVAPAASMQGSQELVAAAGKLREFMGEMLGRLDAPWLKQMTERQMANFDALGGIPLLTRQFDAGKPARETTLKEIRTQALPASFFEVPAGFTRRALPGG